jgi:hypothetical protein
VHVVNLDPAAETFEYPVAIDIRDLISLDDVMEVTHSLLSFLNSLTDERRFDGYRSWIMDQMVAWFIVWNI